MFKGVNQREAYIEAAPIIPNTKKKPQTIKVGISIVYYLILIAVLNNNMYNLVT